MHCGQLQRMQISRHFSLRQWRYVLQPQNSLKTSGRGLTTRVLALLLGPLARLEVRIQRGKGKTGKSKGKDSRLAGLQLAWRTPDGRDLCFAYNSGSCDNSCNRVHQCRVKGCYGDHPAIQHREKAKGSN